MNDLNQFRIDIDEIDKEIITLLEKRFNIARDMKEYKDDHDIDVHDPIREEEVIENIRKRVNRDLFKEPIVDIYKLIMSESINLQSR
jgi:monofunctional chorismate mutase